MGLVGVIVLKWATITEIMYQGESGPNTPFSFSLQFEWAAKNVDLSLTIKKKKVNLEPRMLI